MAQTTSSNEATAPRRNKPARSRPRPARPPGVLAPTFGATSLPSTAPVAPAPQYELAPVPDRSLEAPRSFAESQDRPTFTPGILPPPNARRTGTYGITEDDLGSPNAALRELTPGARLRLPFVY